MPRDYKDVLIDFQRVSAVDGLPKQVYCLSETTRQMILALSHSFYWHTRWQTNTLGGDFDSTQVEQLKDWAARLEHELLSDACSDSDQECIDYPPYAPFIDWEPMNPFVDPEEVPPGYGSPSWQIVTEADTALLLLGLLPGDVITDITKFFEPEFPEWLPTEGFARFRVTLTTPAEIELHLLQIPLGGLITIQFDGNPLTVQTLDLSKDLASLPIETVTEIVWEHIFNDVGEHYIDVTFIPWINDEIPFVQVGGGLRKITICNQREECDVFDVRQNEETPCILEKSDGETWVPFANLQKCPPKIRVLPGGGLEVSVDDGETWDPVDPAPIEPREGGTDDGNRCLAAANAAAVIQMGYEDIRERYDNGGTIIALVAFAIVLLGFVFIAIPAVILVIEVIGLMIAVGGFAAAILDEDDLEAIQCILYCNSIIVDGVVTFDFDEVVSEMQAHAFLPVNIAAIFLGFFGEDGLNRAGATTSITDANCSMCDDCDDTWCWEQSAVHTPGDDFIFLFPDAQVRTITDIEFCVTGLEFADGGYMNTSEVFVSTGGFGLESNPECTGTGAGNYRMYQFGHSLTARGVALVEMNTGAQVVLVRVRGIGDSPFGSSNCE